MMTQLGNDKLSCAVLVNSCDKYSETWIPFFTLLKKYWPDCEYPIYLNTENKKCSIPDISTINFKGIGGGWSDRLINSLKEINSKYVILLLDDFFIQNYVKQLEIQKCIVRMNSEDIGGFYFKRITGHDKASEKFVGYNVIDNEKKYSLCFQASIWDREYLISLLPSGKSPWFIEEEYTLSGSQKKVFCWNSGSYMDCSNDVFPYLWALQSGYGICKSKWLWNNAKLFRKEGIDCKMHTLPHIPRWKYSFRKFLDDALNGKLKLNIRLFDL